METIAKFIKNSGHDRLSVFVGIPLAACSLTFFILFLPVVWDVPGLSSRLAGIPLAADFANYWCAAKLALAGKPALAYNIYDLHELQQRIFGVHHYYGCGWYYPPVFLLMVLPLGFFSYLPALLIWIMITLAGYIFVLNRVSRHRLILCLGLTFPGVFINIIFGQNGFLSAYFLGEGLLLLDRYPVWGGVFLGLLTYKPNIAALAFLALAAGRRWQALLAAIASCLAFSCASLLVFGIEPWLAFFKNISVPMKLLEMGAAFWTIIPTFFSAVLSLGYGVREAYAVQAVVMLAAVAAIFWTWSREASFPSRASVLVLAILLFSPYLFIYDLPILALPLAWLWQDGYDHGRLWGERSILLAAWIMPLVSPIIWMSRIIDEVKLQVGPVIIFSCFILALWRQRKERLMGII